MDDIYCQPTSSEDECSTDNEILHNKDTYNYNALAKFDNKGNHELMNMNVLDKICEYAPDLYDRITNLIFSVRGCDCYENCCEKQFENDDTGLNLNKITRLPKNLISFEINQNTSISICITDIQLNTLFSLHDNLTEITLNNIYSLKNLISLPKNLKIFRIRLTKILDECLFTIPMTLTIFECCFNKIKTLPNLENSNLKVLNCAHNKITTLPKLPNSLIELTCNYNELTNLPKLPEKLKTLICFSNKLIELPILPNSIEVVSAYSNKISVVNNIPVNTDIFLKGNRIEKLNLDMINNLKAVTIPKQYQSVKVFFPFVHTHIRIKNEKLYTLESKYGDNPVYNKIIDKFIKFEDIKDTNEYKRYEHQKHVAPRYRRSYGRLLRHTYNSIKYPKFDKYLDVLKSVTTIENSFLEWKYNPIYKYCRNRLKKEYENLFE